MLHPFRKYLESISQKLVTLKLIFVNFERVYKYSLLKEGLEYSSLLFIIWLRSADNQIKDNKEKEVDHG